MTEHLVWRQDDHGHRFLVATTPSREEAQHLVESMEQGHHKQTYWWEAKATRENAE